MAAPRLPRSSRVGRMGDDRYRNLYEQSVTAILSADRRGVLVDCNQAACRLLARSRSELVGTPLLQWIAPRERRVTRQRFVRSLAMGTSEWQSRLLNPDGGTRAVLIRSIVHGEAEADGLDALIWDPIRPAEPPLGEALRQVLETVPGQFALVLDADGLIRYARNVARTHWRNDGDLLGRELGFMVAATPEAELQLASMRQAIAAGRPWSGRQQHQRADGSRFDAMIYAAPHTDLRSSDVSGALVVGRDISDEAALRARAERAERLAPIGQLVASIAHELQAPLNALRSVLPFLVAGTPESGLCMELDYMAELVEKLDAFASDRAPELRELSLRELVDEVIRQEAPRLLDAAAVVMNDVPADLPHLHADRNHLGRAIREILRNAADAVQDRDLREVRITAAGSDGDVSITVRDTGAGIHADRIDRVLDPFFTTRSGRLGVGLAIVRGIAAAHGGHVKVEAAGVGGGAAITLVLPTRPQPLSMPFRPVPLVLRSLTVLVVDDDQAIRTLLRRVLERVGYVVRDAFSGRSAIAQLATEGRPDLLITDLRMAGGSGQWLLEKLDREYPGLIACTVIITGEPSDVTIGRVAAQTGCPVIRKPIDFSMLLEVLDEVALRAAVSPRRRRES